VKALVVLPVQDLAKQVYQVFQTYCKGTNVKVALASGQNHLEDEQRQLIKIGN
jgi:ATP-dependent RNA helicase DDX51/DBP6